MNFNAKELEEMIAYLPPGEARDKCLSALEDILNEQASCTARIEEVAKQDEKCKFTVSWVGRCNRPTKDDTDFCDSHLNIKCFACGDQATRDCGHTSQFVCGVPMCDQHQHHSDG